MVKTLFLILFVLNSTLLFSSEAPLPNWIDKSRESSDGLPPLLDISNKSMPPSSFRLPAEYEPAKAVVIGWRSYYTMLKTIAVAVVNDGDAEIWAANGPEIISGVLESRYSSINCGLNTVWMRDYGPFGVNERTKRVSVVDSIYRHYSYRRLDDQVPVCVGENKGMEVYGMPIILDGGNLLVDSKGNLFMTKRTYMWNSEKSEEEVNLILKDHLNVKKIHALDYPGFPESPSDGTGHIDMFVKLLSDDTVLISTAETEPFKSTFKKAVDYFRSIKAPNGKDYKILRVKGWYKNRTWYTYTNSLIVNNLVMVPSYIFQTDNNQAAIDVYKRGIPGIKVKLINSDDSISSGGSIHCVTQLIPK